ncbi:gamma-glutamyl-gamma-aminobutyrate hydrolase family protein [Roseburia hominis]
MKPIIGILSCGFTENDGQFVTDSYIRAIILSGGIPVIIPVFPDAGTTLYTDYSLGKSECCTLSASWRHIDPPEEIVARSAGLATEMSHHFSSYLTLCQGFLLPGGGDFTPLLFQETPLCDIGETNLALDIFQIEFAKAVLKTGKPLLGICRGMQVMNAACGGTIYQDLSLQPGRSHRHMQKSRRRSDVSHRIIITPDSILHQVIGDSIAVNSFHHQSIHIHGAKVTISARALDGTIEAIEIANHPFALGVQWHPEAMFETSIPMRNLLSLFLQHCTNA